MRAYCAVMPSVYISGVAESPLGKVTDQSELSMVALAARDALREAGLTFRDVDAVFTNYMGEEGSVQVGEYLGIHPRWADSSDLGGASYLAHVHHAMAAIREGRCEVALIAYASRQRSRRNRQMVWGGDPESLANTLDVPYGLPSPIGQFALVAARHMAQYGTTEEQLASVAVAARKWAQLNPKAWSRDPLSVEDVMASERIADPLKRGDICLVTDGGGAIVVTSEARAKDAVERPIKVLGAAEHHTAWNIAQNRELPTSPAAVTGPAAFAMAGVKPEDVDVFQPYDAFTILPLLMLEDLGFCPKGEGGAFTASGALEPGGSLPSMTSGGGLSYCHPGALGLLLMIEAVRQLRHEAGARQVAGEPEIACCSGMGGLYSVSSTVVMSR
jgi:acetyl-CoA acetyltransferase